MERLISAYGIKAVIGKTGMPLETYRNVFGPHGAVYLSTVGYGLGATYGAAIRRVPVIKRLGEVVSPCHEVI